MTKSTITREESVQAVFDLKAGYRLGFADIEILKRVARMALAAMDSEPVELPLDYLHGHKDGLEWAAQLAEANHPETGDWLYDDPIELAKAIRKGPDMPPVQPVADSEPVFTLEVAREDYKGQKLGNHFGFTILDAARKLEEGNYQLYTAQPAPEYPETLPCPVLLEPGLRFGKGIKTSTMLAALARRDVHESDMAALSPEEIVEFQARIEDFKVLIAQPAPVVPEEATPDSIEILASARRRDHAVFQWNEDQRNAAADSWNACRAAMLAAAPQSPGGDHATVPGKWIPVSERMPEDEQEVLTINKMGHRFVSFFDKHSGLFFDRLDAPAACCIEHVLVTHWMPLPAAPQEVKGE